MGISPAEEEIIPIFTTEIPIEDEEEIIEEVTEEAESVFEEIVLPTVEAAVPIIEAAPIQEAAPVVVEAAEGFFQVQVPVQESAPVEEAFHNEFVPAPAAPEAALTPALAPVPEEPIFTPSLPPAPAQEPFIPIQEPIIVEDAPIIVPAPVEEEFSSFPVVDNTPVAVDEIAQEAVIEAAQNTLPRRVRQRRPIFRPLQPRPNGVSGFFRNLRGHTSKLMQAVRGIFRN